MRARSLLLWAESWPVLPGHDDPTLSLVSKSPWPCRSSSPPLSWPAIIEICKTEQANYCNLFHTDTVEKVGSGCVNEETTSMFQYFFFLFFFCNGQMISFMCTSSSVSFCNIVVGQLDGLRHTLSPDSRASESDDTVPMTTWSCVKSQK